MKKPPSFKVEIKKNRSQPKQDHVADVRKLIEVRVLPPRYAQGYLPELTARRKMSYEQSWRPF